MNNVVKILQIVGIPLGFLLGLAIGAYTEPPHQECPSHHYLRGNCLTQAYVDAHKEHFK